jgi:hypothetical protein
LRKYQEFQARRHFDRKLQGALWDILLCSGEGEHAAYPLVGLLVGGVALGDVGELAWSKKVAQFLGASGGGLLLGFGTGYFWPINSVCSGLGRVVVVGIVVVGVEVLKIGTEVPLKTDYQSAR